MPSVLVKRQLKAQEARIRAWRKRAAPRAGTTPFVEQTAIPGEVPLDAWAGWDGAGWGPASSLFLTTGRRFGGTNSIIYRLDTPGGAWAQESGLPTGGAGAETINKIRNGVSRDSGVDFLWAFYETPHSGQRFLIARNSVGGGWFFVGVPDSEANYDDPVGGRGLGITLGGITGSRLLAGASYNWRTEEGGDRSGRLFEQQPNGAWVQVRSNRPSLMWELEFDDQGRLWEFWNDFGVSGTISRVYVNGLDKGPSPGGDISSACWFKGHMYVIGALSSNSEQRNRISRSSDGSSWAPVYTFPTATRGDHVMVIPRGDGEIWATAHNPFQAAWSLDGVTWTLEASLPSFPTHEESNHRTAVAYWRGGVWIFGRDQAASTTRVFTDWTDDGTPGPEPEPGPTPPPDTGFFPSLPVPPKPPELPTIPVEPTQPTTKAADVFPAGEQPPEQKWVEQADRLVAETSLKFDAILTKWIEEFMRVIKDAWARLGTLVGVISGRIEVLENRVSDTYTWGSGSITVDKGIALPLRVVRSEVLVEFTIAAETASTSGDVQIELQQNGATLINGTLPSGSNFAVMPAEDRPGLAVNDKLEVITRSVGTGVKGVVCQARCS